MGLWNFIRRVLGMEARPAGPDIGRDVRELARRIGASEETLRAIRPRYQEFRIPKRSGGERRIQAPEPELKALQKRIAKRLLGRLPAHPAAHGFEKGRSILTNAAGHAGKSVVVRMDIRDFFAATRENRVETLFQDLGWNRDASRLLTHILAWKGGLPAGSPSSPRLANLVNHTLDARLEGLARKLGATYTRYADDMTFSFAADDRNAIHLLIGTTKRILNDLGYRLHEGKKLRIRRRHQRQMVTGLVVNDRPRLPRHVRRWLRAVLHRAGVAQDVPPSLDPAELAGWLAFARMIEPPRC